MKERKQTRRPDDERQRKQTARRTAERAVAEAEAACREWEGRVAALRAELEDPHLYLTADGAASAGRPEMETARDGWTRRLPEAATRAAEAVGIAAVDRAWRGTAPGGWPSRE